MAVTFCIANSVHEAKLSEEYLDLEDEIHDFLYENREMLLPIYRFIVELDPYEHRIFSSEEVKLLIAACKHITEQFIENKIVRFAEELQHLCFISLQNGKTIVALGD